MEKISCGDMTAMHPVDQDMVAAWFSGWYNQKLGLYVRSTSMPSTSNNANIMKYCADHPKDQLFGVIQASVNQMQKKQ